jgi:hypothetical protein
VNLFFLERMKIIPVPCLEDNYAHLIIDEGIGEAAVVDPVEPQNILQVAEVHGAIIKFVLTTHHLQEVKKKPRSPKKVLNCSLQKTNEEM